jgi:hypothetical protein
MLSWTDKNVIYVYIYILTVERTPCKPQAKQILPSVWLVVCRVLVLLLISRPALRTTSHTLSVGAELVVLSITSWIATGLIIRI